MEEEARWNNERKRKGREREIEGGGDSREREAAAEPMAMRATDVKRVCRDRVERTFHHSYRF